MQSYAAPSILVVRFSLIAAVLQKLLHPAYFRAKLLTNILVLCGTLASSAISYYMLDRARSFAYRGERNTSCCLMPNRFMFDKSRHEAGSLAQGRVATLTMTGRSGLSWLPYDSALSIDIHVPLVSILSTWHTDIPSLLVLYVQNLDLDCHSHIGTPCDGAYVESTDTGNHPLFIRVTVTKLVALYASVLEESGT